MLEQSNNILGFLPPVIAVVTGNLLIILGLLHHLNLNKYDNPIKHFFSKEAKKKSVHFEIMCQYGLTFFPSGPIETFSIETN